MGHKQAFEGVKVFSLTMAITGNLAAKYLADHGATVVKVESMKRIGIARTTAPFVGNKSGADRSAAFAVMNCSQYSMLLNLQDPKGVEVAKKLVAWSDVVIEHFRPGVMERLGLGYDELKEVKPDIIMARASLQGPTGPYSRTPGYGTVMQALAGVTDTIGWPDRPPTGTPVPYPDYPSTLHLMLAVAAALDYRRRTGKGVCLELSQLEATLTFMSPGILEYTTNRRIISANGNRHPQAAPHGAFRCQGNDRWCVIAVFNDRDWEGFKTAIGNPDWASDPKFATLAGRKRNEDEMESLVETWTINFTAEEVMVRLQGHGVAAGVVQNGRDLCEDPQLRSRGYFHWLDHPVMGVLPLSGYSYQLSKTPCKLWRSPCLGEHTQFVCQEILKMPDEEFVELLNSGVFS